MGFVAENEKTETKGKLAVYRDGMNAWLCMGDDPTQDII